MYNREVGNISKKGGLTRKGWKKGLITFKRTITILLRKSKLKKKISKWKR